MRSRSLSLGVFFATFLSLLSVLFFLFLFYSMSSRRKNSFLLLVMSFKRFKAIWGCFDHLTFPSLLISFLLHSQNNIKNNILQTYAQLGQIILKTFFSSFPFPVPFLQMEEVEADHVQQENRETLVWDEGVTYTRCFTFFSPYFFPSLRSDTFSQTVIAVMGRRWRKGGREKFRREVYVRSCHVTFTLNIPVQLSFPHSEKPFFFPSLTRFLFSRMYVPNDNQMCVSPSPSFALFFQESTSVSSSTLYSFCFIFFSSVSSPCSFRPIQYSGRTINECNVNKKQIKHVYFLKCLLKWLTFQKYTRFFPGSFALVAIALRLVTKKCVVTTKVSVRISSSSVQQTESRKRERERVHFIPIIIHLLVQGTHTQKEQTENY